MPIEVHTGMGGDNINQLINNSLILRSYVPPVIEARSDRLAALATNEKIDGTMFRAIKNHNPDGYIVAVGCGMSLGLPLGFHKDSPPKGVGLVDVDKHVVAFTKAFFNAVRQTKNPADFYNRFYRDPVALATDFLNDDQEAQEVLRACLDSLALI